MDNFSHYIVTQAQAQLNDNFAHFTHVLARATKDRQQKLANKSKEQSTICYEDAEESIFTAHNFSGNPSTDIYEQEDNIF